MQRACLQSRTNRHNRRGGVHRNPAPFCCPPVRQSLHLRQKIIYDKPVKTIFSRKDAKNAKFSYNNNMLPLRLCGFAALRDILTFYDTVKTSTRFIMTDKKLVVSKEAIAARINELAAEICRDYAKKELVIIGILNGAFVFMADLVRQITLPLEMDFVRLASYGSGSEAGEIRFIKDIELSITGKDVLIVEDIIDTGRSITFLLEYLSGLTPKSLRVCALIDKKQRQEVDVHIDYVGFTIQEGFLVGYGLDYAGQHRHLPEIYRIQTTTIE